MAFLDPQHPLSNWLFDFKKQNAISFDFKDEIILDYLELARKQIWTLYYGLKLEENQLIPDEHPWAWDLQTKWATIHLAATLHNNPDSNLELRPSSLKNAVLLKLVGDRLKII